MVGLLFQLVKLATELLELILYLGKLLRHRVGDVDLVKVLDGLTVSTDNLCGNTNRRAVLGNLLENDGVCRDLTVIVYLYRAKHLCARANHDVIAKRGVTLTNVLTRTAEGHALIKRTVVAYLGSLADDDSHTVVNKESLAYRRARMDLNTREETRKLAYCSCGKIRGGYA